MKRLKFTFLSGDTNWQDYGGAFVSKKLNNGEFDYWLVIKVENWLDLVGENEAPATYCVTLMSISPDEAGEENLQQAFNCCGPDGESPETATDLMKVDALMWYGVSARLWEDSGNNIQKLMKEARRQAMLTQMLYGFYMDRQQNAIGNSGWDFQRGDIGIFSTTVSSRLEE